MLTTRKNVVNVTKIVPPIAQTQQLETLRRKEVQLLLENLFEREETTVKMILDCLYDIGADRIINQKVSTPIANQIAKKVAKLSKSGIRVIAFRYVKKKFVLSGALTNFLFNKVKSLTK